MRPGLLLCLCLAALCPARAWAEGGGADLVLTEDEITAWQMFQLERYVSAREVAEEVLARDRQSIVANAVLGMVQRYGEGNLPRSLFNLRLARRLLEARFGQAPGAPTAAEWHGRIIEETAFTAAEMERFDEELQLWALYDRLYDPDLPGERIWPLMMLKRFDEARRWAAKALSTGQDWPYHQAMNGLCALENEAGNRVESYRWCAAHAREAEGQFDGGVYLCNAGESARGMFKLEEAERDYLEATRREVEWYANPWMDLAGLYVRGGRLSAAVQAVKSMNEYAQKRPPHTQQQDQGERYRTVAALLVVAGRPEAALPLTERAVRYPDRRGGQSRSPEADLATNALLLRRTLLDLAEQELERSSAGGLWERLTGRLRAAWLRARAFRSSRRAVALLASGELLRGLLEAEGRESFGTPPWLIPDLVEVAGPGPVEAALEVSRSRADPQIPTLLAYLDAFGAEAAAERGDWGRALELGGRARGQLPPAEALLRARVLISLARAYESRDQLDQATSLYLEVLGVDPTLLRRTGLRLPLRLAAATDPISTRTAALLRRSPRVRLEEASPLSLQVQAERGSACHLCLVSQGGRTEGCATEPLEPGASDESAARRCAALFHDRLLAPQDDPSLFDPSALDGSTRTGPSLGGEPSFGP